MDRKFLWTLVAAALGFGLVQLDVSIVNVAFISIARSLHAGTASAAWIIDAYAIAFACMLLPAGALGDRIGAKRTFIAGFATFAVASAGCALAPSLPLLIAMRVLQGIGASTLVPCSLALITRATQHDKIQRARAIALWTAAGSVALAAGPLAGGVLIATLRWPAIFLINIPVCAIAIALSLRVLEETEPGAGRFDLFGQALAVLTLVSATTGIIEAGSLGFGAPIVRIAFTLSALAVCGFAIVERRTHDPMIPLRFLREATFRSTIGVGFMINASLYGTLFILALYLQRTRDYAPLAVGLAFIPFATTLGIANVLAGRLIGRHGPRWPILAGLAVALSGFAFLFAFDSVTAYVAMLPALVLIPGGIGIAVPAMTAALLGTVPPERSGVASGILNTVRQSAGALGVATAAALIAASNTVEGLHFAAALCALAMALAIAIAALGIRRAPRRSSR